MQGFFDALCFSLFSIFCDYSVLTCYFVQNNVMFGIWK